MREPLGHRLVDRLARVERAGRVLEHHLHASRRYARSDVAVVAERLALEAGSRPSAGRSSPRIVRASVVLPQPDSPTSATTSPRAHVEVDAVDRAGDVAADAPANVHVRARRGLERAASLTPRARSPTWMHAARRPAPAGQSSTSRSRTRRRRDRAARVERASGGKVARVGRVAGEPGRAPSGERGRRSSGTPRRAPPCTGARASRTPRGSGPPRRSGPAYMTADRSHTYASTERSWVMNSIAEAELPLQLARAGRAPAPAPSRRARWSARRRSAAAGRTRAPARSGPAAAGRPRAGAGSRPHAAPGARPLEQLADARLSRSAPIAVRGARWPRRSGLRPATPGSARAARPGTRSTSRSSAPPQPTRLHREHVLAVEQHLARHLGAGRQQPEQRARDRRLAAARLAGEPERPAGREVEGDPAHGGDGAASARR